MILYRRVEVEIDVPRRAYTPPDEGLDLLVALVIRDDARETMRYIVWWSPQRERVVIDKVL